MPKHNHSAGWPRNRTGTGNRNRRNRFFHRSLGNGVRKNGVRDQCPYRQCGVDTEFPYRFFSLILCPGESVETELSHWFWRHRNPILNFRIGFLSSIGGRLPYPCLPTPFPILRFQKPKVEPEPPEPFFRNRNRPFLLNCTATSKTLFVEEPQEPKTGTARTDRTEPNRCPCFCGNPELDQIKFQIGVSFSLGRPQSADKKFVRARGPQNWNPEVVDQKRCSRTFACRICPE